MTITLYTRHGCHLCEDAHGVLNAAQKRHRFELNVIDVDTDPQLVAQYDQCVPVVVIDGKLRFRGRIDDVLLERMVASRSASRAP